MVLEIFRVTQRVGQLSYGYPPLTKPFLFATALCATLFASFFDSVLIDSVVFDSVVYVKM